MFQPSWRADFPAISALQRQHQTYLDSAATTQKPQALLDALNHYYSHGAANVHRAQHLPGALATQAFEGSRDKVAAWINAAQARQIVFTHGATSALNLLAYGLGGVSRPVMKSPSAPWSTTPTCCPGNNWRSDATSSWWSCRSTSWAASTSTRPCN